MRSHPGSAPGCPYTNDGERPAAFPQDGCGGQLYTLYCFYASQLPFEERKNHYLLSFSFTYFPNQKKKKKISIPSLKESKTLLQTELCLPNPYVQVLTLNVTAFKKVIKVKCDHKGEALMQ